MPLPQGPEKNAEQPLLNEIEDVSAKMTPEEKAKVGEGLVDPDKYLALDLSTISPVESQNFLQATWKGFLTEQINFGQKTDKELTAMQTAFNEILKASPDIGQKLQQLEKINPNSVRGILTYILQMKKVPTRLNVSLETFRKNGRGQWININDSNTERNPFVMNKESVFKALSDRYASQYPIVNDVKGDGQQFSFGQIAMKQENFLAQKNISYGPDDFYTVQNLKSGQEMPINKGTQQEEKTKNNLNYQAYAGYVIDNTTTPVIINGKQESFSSYAIVNIS